MRLLQAVESVPSRTSVGDRAVLSAATCTCNRTVKMTLRKLFQDPWKETALGRPHPLGGSGVRVATPIGFRRDPPRWCAWWRRTPFPGRLGAEGRPAGPVRSLPGLFQRQDLGVPRRPLPGPCSRWLLQQNLPNYNQFMFYFSTSASAITEKQF